MECNYADMAWHIVTTCNQHRKVLYGELQRSMGYVDGTSTFEYEGKDLKIPFEEVVYLLNLKFNRQQLWYRLELLLVENEARLQKGAELARRIASSNLHVEPEMRHELDNQHAAHVESIIERMNERLDFNNLNAA